MKLSDYVKLVEKDLLAAMNNIISGEVSSKATMTASFESSSPIPLTLMLQQLRELAFRSNSTELLLVDPHINNQIWKGIATIEEMQDQLTPAHGEELGEFYSWYNSFTS